jgi:hypothetical protein
LESIDKINDLKSLARIGRRTRSNRYSFDLFHMAGPAPVLSKAWVTNQLWFMIKIFTHVEMKNILVIKSKVTAIR